jgi:C1A family cysteine protease
MKTAVVIAALAAPALATEVSFSEWANKHGKKYQTKEEVVLRRSIFAANKAKIDAHNAAGKSWSMALNKFADLTADEFKSMYAGGFRTQARTKNVDTALLHKKNVSANPTSVDWSAKGAVTPIKNQGQCGSCWAFSTTGSTEGATFIKTGTLPSLSEQQLVDCSGAEGNQGCNGGLMDQGFQYIIDNKGITTESAYPYTATDGTCASTGKPVAATLTSFTDVPANSETALETAIVQQPVSVAVEADQDVFQFYTSGVMTSTCGTALDHGVLAVGYGTDAGSDYYKVKNSWGADWGMKGYILLGRGATFNPSGQCGIQMMASYPVV